MSEPSFSSTPYSPDRLIAGDKKLVTRSVTVTNNQAFGALSRGAVLGLSAGSYAIVHDGGGLFVANTARAILAQDVDPTAGDIDALVYLEGEFNSDELSFGGGIVAADVLEPLRTMSIHLKDTVDV